MGANGNMRKRTALLDLSMGIRDSQQEGRVLWERTLA